jgi:hypothetical protein
MEDLILEFLFGSKELQQAFLPFIALGLSAVGAATSAIQAGQARKQARQTGRQLEFAEQSRQEIIDPYAGITDLSGMITNPFQNLQVATQAAEMQAAETDISLAGTLDVLRQTGASAGGATALAQAAARAKQGISASIEQQEAQNAQLRAQGEAQAQQMRMAEMQRVQQAQAAGQQFMFGAREDREMQQLNRLAGLQANYMQQQAAGRAGVASALGSGAMALASMDFTPAASSTTGGNANLLTNYSGTYIGRQ